MESSFDKTEHEHISGSGSDQAGTDSDAQEGSESPEDVPRSVRGAPEHMRSVIRRRQNMKVCNCNVQVIQLIRFLTYFAFTRQSARRTRERKREAVQDLIGRHQAQIENISGLEQRVATLEQLLQDIGIPLPPAMPDILKQSLRAARDATSGETDEDDENMPDADELLEEILQILDLETSGETTSEATKQTDEYWRAL